MSPREDKFGIGHVAPPALGPSFPRCEHVWVTQRTMDHDRLPGILCAFRRNWLGRWEGWVVYATPGIPAHGGETRLQLGWVDAGRIERRT